MVSQLKVITDGIDSSIKSFEKKNSLLTSTRYMIQIEFIKFWAFLIL